MTYKISSFIKICFPRKKCMQKYSQPGMVLHACNPSYSGNGGKKISVQDWSWQKHEALSKKQQTSKQSQVQWLMSVILATREADTPDRCSQSQAKSSQPIRSGHGGDHLLSHLEDINRRTEFRLTWHKCKTQYC
jgi:hypothetical protein